VLVASRPVGAGLKAAFPGTTIPAILYVWNGTAWTATYFSSVPVRENVFVRLETREKEFVIDAEGFKSMLQGTTLAALGVTEVQAVEARIKSLSDDLKANRDEAARLRSDLYRNAAYQAMQEVMARAKRAERTQLRDETKTVYMSDGALRDLVRQYLMAIGAPSATPAQIDGIVRALKENIESLLRH
jgi:hypothetical protein